MFALGSLQCIGFFGRLYLECQDEEMTTEKTFRPIAVADLKKAYLFDQAVDRPRNSTFEEDFYTWQYMESGGSRRENSAALAAWRDDSVICTLMLSDVDFAIEGRTVSGAFMHEWYAAPNEGFIGLELLGKALPYLPVMTGAGASLALTMSIRRVRPLMLFPLQRLVAVIDPTATAALSSLSGEHTAAYLNAATIRKARTGCQAGDSVACFEEEYDAAWQTMRPSLQLAVERTVEYMNWRYMRHPRLRYQALRCRSDKGVAYFVWRVEQIPGMGAVARLCEAIGTSDAIFESVPALVSALREIPGVAYADFFCSNDAVCSALHLAGFVHALPLPDLDLPRLFSPLADDVRKTLYFWVSFDSKLGFTPRLEPGRTYMTKGDANQDRPSP
ncbi:hypothetical protein MTBLM1_70039 [Rhodospirillaceae bacterium LM-1]|nr:hypothetical protein MTBLM1_70039 [Rhodospirillaceae bacterium LM-1]